MEYRSLDITIISADGLQNVNLIFKMDVYVVVSIAGDRKSKNMTHIHRRGGTTPKWNHRMRLAVSEADLANPTNLSLLFQLRSDRVIGHRDIGTISVPIQELLTDETAGERVVEYLVRKPSGKFKGELKFSYKFGKMFAPAPATAQEKVHKRIMAYPPQVSAPPPVVEYPYPPRPVEYPYPPPPQAAAHKDDGFWLAFMVGCLLLDMY